MKKQAGKKQRLVLKLGGELLEQPQDLSASPRRSRASPRATRSSSSMAAARRSTRRWRPRAFRSSRSMAFVSPMRQRSTSSSRCSPGAINTRLVAAVRRAGGKAGWTDWRGCDRRHGQARGADRQRGGRIVDLGLVGAPVRNGAPQLLTDLLSRGYVPIVACIGATRDGQLLNVNADTLASHLAAAIGAKRLVIAGGTSGVLDAEGRTIAKLTRREAAQLVKAGTANKGMVAKLQACRAALQQGRRRRGDRRRQGGQARRRWPTHARRSPAVHRWCDEGRHSTTSRNGSPSMCCRRTGASRWRSCAAGPASL